MTQENNLIEALAACKEDEVKTLVKQRIEAGTPPAEIVAECNQGMAELGRRFGEGECFIPELMFGGMIMKNVMAELAPMLDAGQREESIGTVVMGTVQHDVHDIGKDIAIMMLRGVGFNVVDLGVDVPPNKWVEAITEHKPDVVGLSVLLTTCYKSVAATMDAIREAGLRDGTTIMVGGAAASQLLAENAGCDFYGKTAVDGMKYAVSIVEAA